MKFLVLLQITETYQRYNLINYETKGTILVRFEINN